MNVLKYKLLLLILLMPLTGLYCQMTNPRAWAEWEVTDGVVIHQPNFYLKEEPSPVELLIAEEWDSLYVDLIRGLFEEGVKIYYILDTNNRPEYHSGIIDTMNLKYGIDIHHPDFHTVIGCKDQFARLTKWTRDHGPMNVFKNQTDSLYFFLFSDDAKGAGAVMRDYLGMPDTVFYQGGAGNIGSDGGNYIVDGHGMGIVNMGNGAVLPELKSYFGLDTVYALANYLEHADYYLKMVDEETLIISSHHPDDYIYGSEPYTYSQDSAVLSGLVAFFQEQVVSQYGRPMKVFSIPNPTSVCDDSLHLWWYTHYASYTNSLIVNRSVFVPQFNIPGHDSTALAIYRQAMPGYRIVPVFTRRGATAGGGVHCLTNSVVASDPVLIRHYCLNDTVDIAAGYDITARIMAAAGISEAFVHWSSDPQGPFQSVLMQNDSGEAFSGLIPYQTGMTDVYYYIAAVSEKGRSGIKPMVAPDHTFHFTIRGGAPGWISQAEKAPGRILIYPNPSSGIFNADLSHSGLDIRSDLTICLYDIMGKRHFYQKTGGKNEMVLFFGEMGKGTYFLVIRDIKGRFVLEEILIL